VTAKVTDRQREFLTFLRDYRKKHGRPPTYREIGIALGITSKGTVSSMVGRLRSEGLIRHEIGVRRGIRFP
jgi:repressor LexA